MNGSVYERASAHFDDLAFAEQLIVWSLRAWVTAAKGQPELKKILRETLETSGVTGGYGQLNTILTLVTQSAIRSIDVRCGHCKAVSPDECLFMDMLHEQQQSLQAESGYLNLSEWVTNDAVPSVALACMAFASGLWDARLRVPKQAELHFMKGGVEPDWPHRRSTLH